MGLYSFTAGGNTYYLLPSANVQIFPSAFREDCAADTTAPSVVAAKLNTEYNLSHSTLNLNNSNYIISDNITDEPDSNGTIEMSLSGYYCRLVDFSAAGAEEPKAEGHLTGADWNTICNLNSAHQIYFHYYLDYITENSNIDKIIKKVLTPVTSGDTTYSIGIPGSSLDAITDESGDFTYFSGFCISGSMAPPTNSSNWVSFQGLVSTVDDSRVIATTSAKRVIPKEYGGVDLNIVNSTTGTYNLVGNVSSTTSSSAAKGSRSTVFGTSTMTSQQANSQFVIGKYNTINSLPAGITSFNDILFAIGNGTNTKRSNAMLVSDTGNVYANNYYNLNGEPIFSLNMKNGTGTGSLIGNDLNNNEASGSNSTVFGSNIKTNVRNAFIVGEYNDWLVDCYNADPYQDSIFAVGAGTASVHLTPFRIDRRGKAYSENFLCFKRFELKGEAEQPTALIFDTATNTFALGQNLTAISGSGAKISTDLIPDLNAAKITSGTLNSSDRLPNNIPISKLATSGASNGYVIKYNGSAVVWAADEKGSGGSGGGIPNDFPIARGSGTRAIVGNTTYGQGSVKAATAENTCVFGEETRSTSKNQFAVGKYNAPASSLLFMVGDGTSTSNRRNAFTVDTNGNANVRQKLTVGTSLTAGTSIRSPIFEGTSDIRLKENIKDFEYTKSILDLPIKKFDFINGEKNQIGCIAQDLKEFYPELVHENEDGYLTIQETKLVYLLLEEVKLLKNKITELENK